MTTYFPQIGFFRSPAGNVPEGSLEFTVSISRVDIRERNNRAQRDRRRENNRARVVVAHEKKGMSFRTIDLITVKAGNADEVIVPRLKGAVHVGKRSLIRGVHLYYTSRQLGETAIIAGWRPNTPAMWENAVSWPRCGRAARKTRAVLLLVMRFQFPDRVRCERVGN